MDEKKINQIDEVLKTAMENLKTIADVNTVIGKPYTTIEGKTIIPISKITLGYVAGGGEYSASKEGALEKLQYPFAGGSGGYVQLSPMGFLVDNGKDVDTLVINTPTNVYDKLIDTITSFLTKKDSSQDK